MRSLLVMSLLAAAFAFGPSSPAAAADARPAAVMDSLSLLERAVARDSSNFDNLYSLGVQLLDRDRVIEATRVFHKAHTLKPKDHKTLVNLGAALDAAGQADLAQEQYRKALALSPADSVASCRLASSMYAQGKQGDATALLTEVLAKHPRAYCAYFTLGVSFADAAMYKEAIRMWRKVVEIAPTSPEAISARESIDVLEKYISQR
jgi:Flp pilus assembly protein TadD